jgi:hypothetical protein
MKTTNEFLKDYILEYIEDNKIANINELDREDLISYLYGRIDETEIIYYNNAIAFLSEYDPSLYASLEIAEALGYAIADLNSEVLATLLLQEILKEKLENIDDYLAEIFGK